MASKTDPLPQVGDHVGVEHGRNLYPFVVVEPGCVDRNGQIGVHVQPAAGGRAKWEVLERVWPY